MIFGGKSLGIHELGVNPAQVWRCHKSGIRFFVNWAREGQLIGVDFWCSIDNKRTDVWVQMSIAGHAKFVEPWPTDLRRKYKLWKSTERPTEKQMLRDSYK